MSNNNAALAAILTGETTTGWVDFPTVTLQTKLGPVFATFTSADHVHVSTSRGSNDAGAFVVRGVSYGHVSAHLYREGGRVTVTGPHNAPVECLDSPTPWAPRTGVNHGWNVLSARRDDTFQDATPAAGKTMLAAIRDAVIRYIETGETGTTDQAGPSHVLRAAEYAAAAQALSRLARETQEASDALAKLEAQRTAAQEAMRAALAG